MAFSVDQPRQRPRPGPGRARPQPAPSVDLDDGAISGARRAFLLAIVSGAVLLVMASVLSVSIALPDISLQTGASPLQSTWIVDSYTVVLAGLLLPAGALGDRYGRRGTLILGLVIFAVGCGCGAFTHDPGLLIVFRSVTGLGAAFILPSTLSLITTIFPPSSRSKAVGLWAAAAAIGGAFGVIAAGLILRYFDFDAIFTSSALAAVLLAGVSVLLPSTRDREEVAIDVRGAVLSAVSIGLVVVGIIGGGEWGWTSGRTMGSIAAGLLAGALFVRVELRTTRPLLDVRLFRIRDFGSAALSIFVTFTVMFAVIFLTVQFLQYVRGDTPLVAGLSLVPIAFTTLPLAVLAPTLANKIGMRTVLLVGGVFLALSLVMLARLTPGGDYAPFGLAMLVLGAGLGLLMAPATDAIVAAVPMSKQGVASAVNDATREIAAALGIALGASILASRYRIAFGDVADRLPARQSEAARDSTVAALRIADQLGPAGQSLRLATRDAFTAGMHDTLIVMLAILIIGLIGVGVTCPGRRRVRPSPTDATSAN